MVFLGKLFGHICEITFPINFDLSPAMNVENDMEIGTKKT